jgi:hypothetical protein
MPDTRARRADTAVAALIKKPSMSSGRSMP